LDLSRTELEKAKVTWDNSALKLSRTEIKAPFSGYITYRGATLGMTISSTTHLFTLVDREVLVTHLLIPQGDILRVKKGLPVKITCGAIPDITFSGSIQIINPVIDPASGTLKLRARIEPDENNLLRPGMFITARIITASKKDALLVPRKAGFYDDEKRPSS